MPLSLLAIEKRRPFWAAAAITAIPLSGQVSLALGAVPFFVAYAFVRGRGLLDAVPGTVAALVAGCSSTEGSDASRAAASPSYYTPPTDRGYEAEIARDRESDARFR